MKIVYVIGALVLVVLAAAGGFYGGVTYAQSQPNNAAADFARQRAAGTQQNGQGTAGPCGFTVRAGQFNRQGGQGGQNGQGGQGSQFAQLGECVARGPIKSVDPSTGTVQISTPVSVVTVKVDKSTVISKTDVGSLSDLKTGDTVTVFSRESGDSPTASAIQLQRVPTQVGQ
jgi:hypothetical protein